MVKKIFLTFVIIIVSLFILINVFSKEIISYVNDIDAKYGDTIPYIEYNENLWPNRNDYNLIYVHDNVSLSVLYIDKNIMTNNESAQKQILAQKIVQRWKPYLKNPNETIIYVTQKNGNIDLKFIENTGVYASANAARKAINESLLETGINNSQPINAIYMFTVK